MRDVVRPQERHEQLDQHRLAAGAVADDQQELLQGRVVGQAVPEKLLDES